MLKHITKPYREETEKADPRLTRNPLDPHHNYDDDDDGDVVPEHPAKECHKTISASGTTLTTSPPTPPKHFFPASLNPPAVYGCQEARSAILKPETTLTVHLPGPLLRKVSVYFNYELDTLYDPRFQDGHYCRLAQWYGSTLYSDQLKVRHVMADADLEKPWHFKKRPAHWAPLDMDRVKRFCLGPQTVYRNLRTFTVHVGSPRMAQRMKDQGAFHWSRFHVERIAELGKRFVFRFSIPEDDRDKWTKRDGDLFISWGSDWKDFGRDLERALVSMAKGDIDQRDSKSQSREEESTDPVRSPSASS